MRSSIIVFTGCLAILLCGCGDAAKKSPWDQVEDLGREKISLEQQVETLEKENATLSERVVTLSSLDGQVRVDLLNTLEKVEISKRSGLFDKDNDGTIEKLVVIIVPYDDGGDKIKAVGAVEIRLLDPNADAGDMLLFKRKIEAEELKKRWMGLMLTGYYHLRFDVGGLIKENAKELTVNVKFTDYLTGKIFRAQHVIKL